MKLTGAIFDFNGTLFFDSDYHNQAWNRLSYEIRNQPITIEEMNSGFHGVPNVEAIENLIPNKYTMEQKQELSQLKEKIYRDICLEQPSLSLVEGATQLFDWFVVKEIPFTIASASIIENIEFFCDVFNLTHWIKKEDIIYDDGTYADKVEMFNDALKNIHTDKDHCLIFEDSESGVKNAIKAGFKKIIVLHYKDYNPIFSQYPEVLYHANNFIDILNFLQKEDK